MMLNIQPRLSPNYNERPTLEPINMLVLHYTGMQTGNAALERLCSHDAQVSAHYFIEESGEILQLVEEEHRAWHAGISHWRGRDGVNDVSIGIEIVNPGHEWGYRAFPAEQMASVAALCKDIIARHDMPAANVIGHSDIAPGRKEDPGELFDWAWLAQQGVGLYAQSEQPPSAYEGTIEKLQKTLQEWGYAIEVNDEMDEKTCAVITAFQRHYRPALLTGEWDAECEAVLAQLQTMR